MSDNWVKQSLLDDANKAQREAGVIPTVRSNEDYILETLRRMDRKESEDKPKPKPKPKPTPKSVDGPVQGKDSATAKEYDKLTQQGGRRGSSVGYRYSTGGLGDFRRTSKPLAQGGGMYETRTMDVAEKRMRRRLRLIRSKPDLADKLARINPLALQGQLGEHKQREAEHEVRKVIQLSEKYWGPWWKPPPRPIWSNG